MNPSAGGPLEYGQALPAIAQLAEGRRGNRAQHLRRAGGRDAGLGATKTVCRAAHANAELVVEAGSRCGISGYRASSPRGSGVSRRGTCKATARRKAQCVAAAVSQKPCRPGWRDGADVLRSGRFSHAIRKGPLLPPAGAATTGLFAAETITPACVPADDEMRLAVERKSIRRGPIPGHRSMRASTLSATTTASP